MSLHGHYCGLYLFPVVIQQLFVNAQIKKGTTIIFYPISVQENKEMVAIKDKDLEAMTDSTLRDIDLNDDGYISWGEYKKRADERERDLKNNKN